MLARSPKRFMSSSEDLSPGASLESNARRLESSQKSLVLLIDSLASELSRFSASEEGQVDLAAAAGKLARSRERMSRVSSILGGLRGRLATLEARLESEATA